MTESSKIPFFSIIIPVYNAGEYLSECLESILNQDFYDWEAILVDDGSTDNSVEISELYAKRDSRIKLFKSAKNSGCAYVPRLHAAKLSQGKFIVPIDADDTVSQDLLQTHYEAIILKGSDMVIPEMWKQTTANYQKLLPLEKVETSKIWKGKDLVAFTLCGWDIPMSGFAIRSDLYFEGDKQLTPKEKQSIFSDEVLSRWILFLCKNVTFSKSRYFYRNNNESVTHSNIQRAIESRLSTSDSIITMTAQAFGDDSPTYFRALENKLYASVDLLRSINTQWAHDDRKKEYIQMISDALKDFQLKKLKGKTSPRYLALMRLPIPLARIALKILDPIYRKN